MEAVARAKQAREKVLEEGRNQQRAAKSKYESAVAAATSEAKRATSGEQLARLGSTLRLFDNRLETPNGTVPLSREIRATAEVSGEKRKDFDNREVLLLLDTPSFDAVVRCDPGSGLAAREFAAKVNTAAKNAEDHLRVFQRRIDDAQRRLAIATADKGGIEAATAHLGALEADNRTVEQAEASLAAVEVNTSALDARREEVLTLDPTTKLKPVKAPRAALVGARPVLWWRDRSRWAKVGLIVGGSLFALLGLGIVIGSVSGGKNAAKSPGPTQSERPRLTLSIARPGQGRLTTTDTTYAVKGFATSDASVSINGKVATRRGARFSLLLPLRKGENAVRIKVSKSGFDEENKTITIVRRLPLLQLSIVDPMDDITVRQPTYTISGRAPAGARIQIAGDPVPLTGGRFQLTVQLNQGKNVFGVRADRAGFASRYTRLTITRRLSAEEIRQQQEERRQAFINATVTISYNQLIKNPEAYAGRKVKYYGEILQIQESYGGGIMLLYVTDLGYDVWTDQIWVNYTGRVRGGQGDKLTVYGTVVGTKSYETQIGGKTYVPEIDAVYISE